MRAHTYSDLLPNNTYEDANAHESFYRIQFLSRFGHVLSMRKKYGPRKIYTIS